MNKVTNWSIISAVFFAVAFAFTSTPYIALILAGMGLLSAYAAVVRYEDHVGFQGSMSMNKR